VKYILDQIGGHKSLSLRVLNKYNKRHPQSHDFRETINKSVDTDAGVNIIGENENLLCILTNTEYRYNKKNKKYDHQISTFGGGSNKNGEQIIETAIRETIEELFNIVPTTYALHAITSYVTTQAYHDDYYITEAKGGNNSTYYCYTFDVSVIGIIIDKLVKFGQTTFPFVSPLVITLESEVIQRKGNYMLNLESYLIRKKLPSLTPDVDMPRLIRDKKMDKKILEKLSQKKYELKRIGDSVDDFNILENLSGLFENSSIDYIELEKLLDYAKLDDSDVIIYEYFKMDLINFQIYSALVEYSHEED
jgi:hypothetical protein